MKKIILAVVALSACAMSQAAHADAKYNFIINSSASYTVYQYDSPTDTANISGPYLSPNSTTRGTMTGTATATASSQTATSYVGTTLGSPTYAKVECGFTVVGGAVNSNGTCTAPTISASVKAGTGAAPHCYVGQVTAVPNTTCQYNATFTYAP